MTIIRLIILLTIIPLTTYSQKADSIRTKKFYFGLTFSPDYCYRTLKSDNSKSSMFITDYRDTTEIPKIGFTTGLNLIMEISKRIAIETGLLFSDKGEKTKAISKKWISNSGQSLTSLPSKVTANFKYYYLDIPIKVNYYLKTEKLKLYVTAGISPNIFLVERSILIYEYNDGRISRNTTFGNNGFSRVNLAFIAGLGCSYDVTQKIFLKIEPTFRHSITSINNTPIKGYLYSAGLNTGLYFKL